MELHAILEEGVVPTQSLWYVVSAFGDRPSLRVGHTSTPQDQPGNYDSYLKSAAGALFLLSKLVQSLAHFQVGIMPSIL